MQAQMLKRDKICTPVLKEDTCGQRQMKHDRVRPPPIDESTLKDPLPRTQSRARRCAKSLGMSNRAAFSFLDPRPRLCTVISIFHLHRLARHRCPQPPLCDFSVTALCHFLTSLPATNHPSSTTPAATLQWEAGRTLEDCWNHRSTAGRNGSNSCTKEARGMG